MGRSLPIDLVDDHWEAREPIEHEGWDGATRVIPKGFPSDLASVPWFLGWLLPKFSEVRARAAYPHDFFYRLQLPDVDRMAADRMFFRDLILRNAYVWRAVLMYLGLRWFGWIAWRKNRKLASAMRGRWLKGSDDA